MPAHISVSYIAAEIRAAFVIFFFFLLCIPEKTVVRQRRQTFLISISGTFFSPLNANLILATAACLRLFRFRIYYFLFQHSRLQIFASRRKEKRIVFHFEPVENEPDTRCTEIFQGGKLLDYNDILRR